MSELVDFLTQRLAEDEAAARACVWPAHDGYKPHPELSEWFVGDTGEVEYVQTPEMLAHRYAERWYVTCDGEGLTPSVDGNVGTHVARHDPARVLREVTAKRTILALLVDAEAATSEAPQEAKPFCSAHADGLRLAARALAAPFCDHPDFQEQWR